MAEKTWHGIPREKISWYPSIDYEKCVSCGKCIDFCHMKVFASKTNEGTKKTIVEKPNSCVVTCTGCDSICPTGAIKHPSKQDFLASIKQLKKNNPEFQPKKGSQTEE